MAEDGRVVFRYVGDTSPLDDANRQAEGKFSKMGSIAVKAVAAIGTAAVAAGTSIVKSGVEFESAFAGVLKTVDGTEEQLNSIRDGILDMSEVLPATASEIAAVSEAAGQLGIETDNVLGFTRTMIDLGEATNMSADQAATALARLANIVQMPQEDFDKLGSAIVALGNNLATTESEITEMSLRLAGAASEAGFTESQMLALAGALSSVGIGAEAGGGSMSRVLNKIGIAVAKGGKDLKGFADVAGMSAQEFAQKWNDDAAGAFTTFVDGLGRVQEAGGSVALTLQGLKINETMATTALTNLAGAGNLLASSINLSSEAWGENTALAEEASKRYETVESRFAALKNQVTNTGIALYDDLREPLVGVMDAFGDALDELQENGTLDMLGESLGMLAETLGGLIISILPVLIDLINLIVPPLTKVIDAILPPIVKLIEAAMPLIEKIIETLLPVFLQIIEKLLPPLIEIAEAILPILIDVFEELSEPLLDLIIELLPPLVELLALLAELMRVLAPILKVVAEALGDTLGGTIEAIMPIIDGLVEVLRGVIDFLIGVFTGDWDRAWDGLVSIVKNALNLIPSIVEGVVNIVISALNGLFSGINKLSQGALSIPEIGKVSIPRLRVGMDYVPEDDFPALLHRGEMVLTAQEATDYRRFRAEGALSAGFLHSAAMRESVNITIGDINVETSAPLNTLSGARHAGNLLEQELSRELRNRGWNP